jgi:hypothetical protein
MKKLLKKVWEMIIANGNARAAQALKFGRYY